MLSASLWIVVSLLHRASGAPAAAEKEDPLDQVEWKKGPTTASLGGQADIKVPPGFIFADPKNTQLLMEALHNPSGGDELGTLATNDLSWFCVFSFDETGYVRDDEKDKLDSSAMLKSIKQGTEQANVERKRRGWTEINVVGWEKSPYYNDTTHNLEWAIRATSENTPVVNHSTRLLGRRGVMKVVLITDPETLPEVLPRFQALLNDFKFAKGNSYAEFRPGDKVAQYGLTALVVGGAAAVAVKTGAAKWLWKLIVVVAIAGGGYIKRLFSRDR